MVALVVALLSTSIAIALVLYSPNFGKIAAIIIAAPLTSIALIFFSARERGKARLICIVILGSYALVNWQVFRLSEAIRSEVRWLVDSEYWKAKVLKEPAHAGSKMQCLIWDGWGMFAQDTDVYLIFSPDDRLRNYSPSNLSGLPVPVWHVQRLEKQWYSVTFYTNEGWDGCSYSLQ
jgi:hypothetical protein